MIKDKSQDLGRIFHDYDIRGRYPQEVNEGLVKKIAQGFTDYLGLSSVVVGRDERKSSKSLLRAIIIGFSSSGIKVIDIGETFTPKFYYAVKKFKVEGGVMITASHLPEGYNGMKFALKGAMPLDEMSLKKIKKLVESMAFNQALRPPKAGSKDGKIEKRDIGADYTRSIKEFFPGDFFKSKIPGLFAAGNPAIVRVLKSFGNLQVLELGGNREANPVLAKGRVVLSEAVKSGEFRFGAMFDADGDRVIFVDDKGELIHPSWVIGLLGSYLVRRSKEKKVVIDARAGFSAEDLIKEAGGRIIRVPAWHTQLKWAMAKDKNIVFGSETSGHMIWRKFFPIDDGIVGGLLFALMLKEKGERFLEDLRDLERRYFAIPEKNFVLKSKQERERVIKRVAEYYQKPGFRIERIDGVTVSTSMVRFNLRESKTEWFLRLNLEAKERKAFEESYQEVKSLIRGRQKSE